jgi:anti-sigma B factor antagonist
MAAYQRLEISEGGDVTVVRFRDRHIADILEIEQVGQELYRLVEEGRHKRLVLDFSNVDYLSSALIGKLLSLNAKIQARDGSVKLCSIRPEVLEVFHTCKFDRIFSISKDVADASLSF